MRLTNALRNHLIQSLKGPYHRVCRWIPDGISNPRLMRILHMLRILQRPSGRRFSKHEAANEVRFAKHKGAIEKAHGYIEDQNHYTDLAFGKVTMQFSGCEIFAVYNAIFSLTGTHRMSLARMITEFERDGMIVSGRLGTAPSAIIDFFRRNGYRTEMTTDETAFDRIAESHDTLILIIYNDRTDAAAAVHTVNVSKKHGKYTAHNVYGNGHVIAPCSSIEKLIARINGGRARGIAAIGISRPDPACETGPQ